MKNLELLDIDVHWIKSHQDDNTPHEALKLPAQLNCDADALATIAHNKPCQHNHNVIPLTPECPVHIDVEGKTTSSEHQAMIRSRWNNDT